MPIQTAAKPLCHKSFLVRHPMLRTILVRSGYLRSILVQFYNFATRVRFGFDFLISDTQMADIEEILKTARERARKTGLPYAGALTPREAFELWHGAKVAQLVDVRTHAEFYWIGRIPGAVEIEFSFYPGNARNPEFLAQLESMVSKDAQVMFLCRSGGGGGRRGRGRPR